MCYNMYQEVSHEVFDSAFAPYYRYDVQYVRFIADVGADGYGASIPHGHQNWTNLSRYFHERIKRDGVPMKPVIHFTGFCFSCDTLLSNDRQERRFKICSLFRIYSP